MEFWKKLRLDDVERVYLIALRVGVLAIATLSLLCAGYFAVDAAWRMFVSTDVAVEPTVVEPGEVSAVMRDFAAAREAEEAPDGPQIPGYVRERHDRFMEETFAAYHRVYAAAAEQYNKSEDETLTAEELADRLGYSLEIYASGTSPVAKAFVEQPEFQRQSLAAVTAALADPASVGLLAQYRDADRVEHCTTRNVRRTVRQICGYYYTYDCSYTETVPTRRCEMVYPDGIVSPLAAFTQADQAFGELWIAEANRNEETAQVITSERHATRSQIGPKLILALQVIGGFLVIMFFFLLVSIERHMRRLALEVGQQDTNQSPAESPARRRKPRRAERASDAGSSDQGES